MEASEAPSQRGRLVIAGAATALLAAIVVVVLLLGGGEGEAERAVVPPSPECVEAWNADPEATAYGRHNFNFHRYEGALVTFLDQAAEEVGEGEGECAVVFPSRVLDSEPIAAGQLLQGRVWKPISSLEGIDLTRVAELQVLAAEAPNAALDGTGELADL
jgi:hypothetical protein